MMWRVHCLGVMPNVSRLGWGRVLYSSVCIVSVRCRTEVTRAWGEVRLAVNKCCFNLFSEQDYINVLVSIEP